MPRTSGLILLALLFTSSTAVAQRGDGAKRPAGPIVQEVPAEAPLPADDPYAEPAKPVPAKPAPKKPAPKKPAPKKPAPKAAEPTLQDPYGPAPQTPVDPYADPAPTPQPAPTPAPKPAPATPTPPAPAPPADKPVARAPVAAIPQRVSITDLVAVQGLLAVQRLDGWLLVGRTTENPIAVSLVRPEGTPTRPWFYLLPAKGEPRVLAHASEAASFEHLPGAKATYTGHADMQKQLKAMLKGVKNVAAEYSAKAQVPAVSRLDAGTVEMIRAAGAQVRSSEMLVQFTKAIWGDAGRVAHFVAAHHLAELKKDAFTFVAKAIQSGQPVTEYDVQQRLARGLTTRGLVGSPAVVAAGVNTADPYYVPTAAKTSPIKRGDVLLLSLAAKTDQPDGVWAAQTWVAVVDATVPERVAGLFTAASAARDAALAVITERTKKRRPVTGAEADDAARKSLAKAGFEKNVMHRTGHSLDTDLQGAGADLDNFEIKDTRILTAGTGFTVGPGIYVPGELGVRTEVTVFLSPSGPEVTTSPQPAVEALLGRR